MKKTILIISMVFLGIFLAAQSRDYAVLELLSADKADIDARLNELSAGGIRTLHFKQDYILADFGGKALYKDWQRLPALQTGEKLYIYTPQGGQMDVFSRNVRVLWQAGEETLFASALAPESLRSAVKGSFTELSDEAVKLPNRPLLPGGNRSPDSEISALVAQVSSDSLFAFIQGLEDLQTRYALADNRLAVANWIKAQFERFGMPQVELMPFEWHNTTQYNVVATLPGRLYPDEYVILGGHHDSITYTTPFVLAPGADDNASGAASGLEMARVLMQSGWQPNCSIRIITFAAEEFGLHGSTYYADSAFKRDEKIRLMINHDMIGSNFTGENRVRLMPYYGSEIFTELAAGLTQANSSLSVEYGSLNSASSDSYSFWRNGYPVIYYFENDFSQHYHSDDDLCIHIDPVYAGEVVRASFATALTVSMQPAAPQGFAIQDLGDGQSLSLSWQASADDAVSHYRILYAKSEAGEAMQMVESSATSIIIDALDADVFYDFYLYAINLEGWESQSSHLTACTMEEPRAPVGFGQKPVKGGVHLSWNANTELDIAGYRLFRSQAVDSEGYQIVSDLISECSFTDFSVQGSPDYYYYYTLFAEDTAGNLSQSSLQIKSRPLSLNCGVLIVDESLDYSGSSPLLPTDAMVDDFFDEITSAYPTMQLDLQTHQQPLQLADIGIYSTLLWHNTDVADPLPPSRLLPVLEDYLAAGGNIFYTGYHPAEAFAGSIMYPADFDADSFIYRVAGISHAKSKNQARFKAALPALGSIYPSLRVDPEKTVEYLNGHILGVDAITPILETWCIYSYDTDHAVDTVPGIFSGECIAVHHHYGKGQIFTLSFPLYYMEVGSAKALVEAVFEHDFKEKKAAAETQNLIPRPYTLCYPNPFKESSKILLYDLAAASPLNVEIYNVKGQLVRRLYEGEPMAQLSWNGTDDNGNSVGSGVYFMRLSQNGKRHIQKLLRLR